MRLLRLSSIACKGKNQNMLSTLSVLIICMVSKNGVATDQCSQFKCTNRLMENVLNFDLKFNDMNQRLDALETQNKELQKRNENLEEMVHTQESKIGNNKLEIFQLKELNEELDRKFKRQQSEIGRNNVTILQLKSVDEESKAQIMQLNVQINYLESTVHIQQSELENNNDTMFQLKGQNEALERNVQTHQWQINNSNITTSILKRQIEQLYKIVQRQQAETETNNVTIVQLKAIEEDNKAELILLKRLNKELKDRIEQVIVNVDYLNITTKNQEAKLMRFEGHVAHLNKTTGRLQKENRQFNTTLEMFRLNELAQARKRSSDFNTTMQNLQIDLIESVEWQAELNHSIQHLQIEMLHVNWRTSEMYMSITEQETKLAEFSSELHASLLDLDTAMFLLETRGKELNDTALHLKQENAYQELNTTVHDKCADVTAMQGQVDGQNASLRLLQITVTKLYERNEEMNRSVEAIQFEINAFAENNKRHNSTVHVGTETELHATNATTVAFKARLLHHTSLTGGETLIFDEVLRNTYVAYNRSTGVFIAPFDGNYMFSVTAMSQNAKSSHLKIVKNNITELGRFFTGIANSGSETVVVDLKKGDQICVKQMLWGSATAAYVQGNGLSSFMGVLLALY